MPLTCFPQRLSWIAFLAGWVLFGSSRPCQGASLTIELRHLMKGAPLAFDAPSYRTPAGEDFSISRLSYLISRVGLQRIDGTWVDFHGSEAWIDGRTNRSKFQLKSIPSGDYRALRFTVGLDAATDKADPGQYAAEHPLNPNLNDLHWSWQGGYIFMALEGHYRSKDGQQLGYVWHLARQPARTDIMLIHPIAVVSDTTLSINFDVSALIDGGGGISFARDGATTHSKDGDPLLAKLKINLSHAFAIAKASSSTSWSAGHEGTTREPTIALSTAPGVPQPALPDDNPLTSERISLGRRLFFESALSRDGSLACASCHQAGAALADPRRFSIGVEGRTGDRNAMPLFNLAWKSGFFWDGRAPSLRAQALTPIADHREMDETPVHAAEKLQQQSGYAAAFEKAFDSPGISPERIGLAIEAFLLTLTSFDSKFDKAQRGEATLTADEQRGFDLFMMEREPRLGTMGADCFHCHGGALFSDHQFHNNGLKITDADTGRERVTKSFLDRGSFVTPSLRNIALTAPYMHDGRFATLEEVIDHYSTGVQRSDLLDPNLAKHPEGGLQFTAEDKRCLIAFLRTLTDERFIEKAATLTTSQP